MKEQKICGYILLNLIPNTFKERAENIKSLPRYCPRVHYQLYFYSVIHAKMLFLTSGKRTTLPVPPRGGREDLSGQCPFKNVFLVWTPSLKKALSFQGVTV